MEDEDKKKLEKINEEFNRGQSKIIRDPIVAFLIIKVKNGNKSFYINTMPVTTDWNNFNEDNSIYAEDEIIGVVSAPQHSYMVSGLFPRKGIKYPDSGTFKSLGYEFEGAYCPDWKKELERRIKNGEIEDNLGDEEKDNLGDEEKDNLGDEEKDNLGDEEKDNLGDEEKDNLGDEDDGKDAII